MGKVKNLLGDELMKDITEEAFRDISHVHDKDYLHKKYLHQISIVKTHMDGDSFQNAPLSMSNTQYSWLKRPSSYLRLLEYAVVGITLDQQEDKLINILTRK